ncbi:MAG: ion channel [Synechococcales bacterium]|nr:ion channel [Synechococcales bacterium]
MRNLFGRRLRYPKVKIENRDGRFHIEGLGAWYSYWRDPYHLMLTIPWSGFLGCLAGAYFLINSLFAGLYLLDPDGVANMPTPGFLNAFAFSVQTFASIGYGAMHPVSAYAHLLVTLEALVSLLSIALVTGLCFARFSKPTARVIFSRVAVISRHDHAPMLMFRMANQRRNQILEAELRVCLLRDEISAEGEFMRRLYDLKLLRSRTPSLTLTWTVMHPIDEDSPLYHCTPESLEKTHAQLLVSLSGVDETVTNMIYARHAYVTRDIFYDYRFVDMLHLASDGHRYMDYTSFHEVERVKPGQVTGWKRSP